MVKQLHEDEGNLFGDVVSLPGNIDVSVPLWVIDEGRGPVRPCHPVSVGVQIRCDIAARKAGQGRPIGKGDAGHGLAAAVADVGDGGGIKTLQDARTSGPSPLLLDL